MLGRKLRELSLEPNRELLHQIYQEKYGLNFKEFLANEMQGALDLDKFVNWRMEGCRSFEEYQK